jgi:hypothetical protein
MNIVGTPYTDVQRSSWIASSVAPGSNPPEGNTIVALGIAVLKASLVVLFFMHVKYSSRLIQLMVAAAFLWLALLISGTLSDYVTRSRVNHAPVARSPTGAALEDR